MNNIAGRLEKETQFYEKMKEKLNGMPKVIGEYCTSMRANRKSYTTVNVYINNVLHFARFVCGGNITDDFYKNITPSDVENYMISLETKETSTGVKRMGDDILQSRWSSLNTFFDWCLKRGYVDKNPMGVVSRPKNNTEHKVTYLTKPEINKLFKASDRNENKIFRMRDKTIISLALATALRVSALVNINIDDIDFEAGVIKVVEKRQKVREIPIGENMMIALREFIEFRKNVFEGADSQALFLTKNNNRLSVWDANDMLEKYCDRANIKRITFHKLRASAATNLAAAKVDIQTIGNILGHKSTSTTLKYVAVLEENKKNAVGLLDNLF